jgi:hypothetical protein
MLHIIRLTKNEYFAELARELGEELALKRVASRLLQEQIPIDTIVKATGLSELQVQSLQEKPQE